MVEYFFTPVLYPRKIDAKFCDCGPNLFLQSGRRNAVFILKFIVHNQLRSINKPLSWCKPPKGLPIQTGCRRRGI